MEFFILACIGVIVAVILFWIVVYPAILLFGIVIHVSAGVLIGMQAHIGRPYL